MVDLRDHRRVIAFGGRPRRRKPSISIPRPPVYAKAATCSHQRRQAAPRRPDADRGRGLSGLHRAWPVSRTRSRRSASFTDEQAAGTQVRRQRLPLLTATARHTAAFGDRYRDQVLSARRPLGPHRRLAEGRGSGFVRSRPRQGGQRARRAKPSVGSSRSQIDRLGTGTTRPPRCAQGRGVDAR